MADRGKRMEKGSIKIRIPEEQKVFFGSIKNIKFWKYFLLMKYIKKRETKFKLMFQVI